MRGIWNKRTTPIGLGIGHDSVKLLQLTPVGSVLTATASARWQFPESAADDPAVRRRLAVQAVRELLVEGCFKGRRVVSCLASDQVVIKQVRLPHMTESERHRALLLEANERFGFKVEADRLHHLLAGEIRIGAEIRDEVILLGVSQEVVDDHLAMLDEMNLYPVSIDVEPACMFRSIERFLRRSEDVSSVTVLVDIGASATRVVIARGQEICFIKSIPLGGWSLNKAVADRLNLSGDEAAQLRLRAMRQVEGEPSEQIAKALHDAIRSVAEELAREISLCLRYYAVTFRGAKPASVTLVGGEVYDPSLQQLLSESLNLPCQSGEPFRGIDLSLVDLGADRRGRLSEWAVAVGLALREIPTCAVQETADEPNRLSA
jgi:type IV pilus assembly protein PilM